MRKFSLLVISLLCYALLVKWQIILLLLLAGIVLLTDKMTRASYQGIVFTAAVLLLICGFLIFKGFTSLTMIVGYSVFAFSGISYIVDQYKRRKKYSSLDTLVYLFFFPKMMAGPIVRASEFIPQLSVDYKWNTSTVYQGFKLVLYGCFIKFIIADNLLGVEHESTGLNLFMQSLIWGVRFYLDFYAYSIIAVGIAWWMGIQLPYNFANPYSSRTFRDFWKRWNITLSSWLSDYIYIPLGGNKHSKFATSVNILLTFVVSGLWHGISIPFVLWGLGHGTLVIIERFAIRPSRLQNAVLKQGYRILVIVATMLLWQLFRFEDYTDIFRYGHELCSNWIYTPAILWTFGIAIASLLLIESKLIKQAVFCLGSSRASIFGEVSLFTLMLVILLLCPYNYTFNFFYFNF